VAESFWKDSDEIFLNSDDIWFDFYLTDTIVDSITIVDELTPNLLLLPNVNDSIVISETLQGLLPKLFADIFDSILGIDYVDFDLYFLIDVYMPSVIHTMVIFDSTIPNNQTVVLASGVQKVALYNSWMN